MEKEIINQKRIIVEQEYTTWKKVEYGENSNLLFEYCEKKINWLHFPYEEYFGYVYVIEFGEKLKRVKVGCSQNVDERISYHNRMLKIYSDFNINKLLISPIHSNYQTNEKLIHKSLNVLKKHSEIFFVDMEEFLILCPKLEFKNYVKVQEYKPKDVGFFSFTGTSKRIIEGDK